MTQYVCKSIFTPFKRQILAWLCIFFLNPVASFAQDSDVERACYEVHWNIARYFYPVYIGNCVSVAVKYGASGDTVLACQNSRTLLQCIALSGSRGLPATVVATCEGDVKCLAQYSATQLAQGN